MATDFIKNKHLAIRAGFGISLAQVERLNHLHPEEFWKELAQSRPFRPINFTPLKLDFDDLPASQLDAEQKKQLQRRNQKQINEINLKFLQEMVSSEDQLREKMAFFWHGHFASRSGSPQFNELLLNKIRENALGNFKSLLLAVSTSPAMLNFLNNQQNSKGHPNENFARELMELFTMGRGNYTEHDVREAARAFTGWSYNKDAVFIQRKDIHDEGMKTFLGKTGNFDGNAILDIILEQPAAAKFIATKIYRFFVNEKADDKLIHRLSEKLYATGYEIMPLLEDIFTSPWFFKKEHMGSKIKSPIELMVGMMRILDMKVGVPENLITYQKLLGQMLLYPPNVAGWPSGRSWIDSSTLLLRMQMPQIWTGLRPLDLKPRPDDDLEMGLPQKQNLTSTFKDPKMSIDWSKVEASFAGRNVSEIILQKSWAEGHKVFQRFSDGRVRTDIIDVMSTPEYQLC
ncbi:DUF1800 domain-containing protein [Sphingobacterium multivorum]|uniref:DUF1800 domain-containing protein n=1 Tax=Sphingobacterium multivorum TaxID=28454 RepID=UPI003DA4F718